MDRGLCVQRAIAALWPHSPALASTATPLSAKYGATNSSGSGSQVRAQALNLRKMA